MTIASLKTPATVFFTVVAAMTLISSRQAIAGAPTDQLRARIESIRTVVTAAGLRPEERQAAVAAMDEMFDWPAIAQDVLRAQWELRTPEEREEFTKLFARFFSAVYASKSQLGRAERFEFLGDKIEGDRAVVHTTTVTRRGDRLPVTYHMRLQGGERWKVYEFDVDGTNLIGNYRAQFQQVIVRGSYGELVKRLRELSTALER